VNIMDETETAKAGTYIWIDSEDRLVKEEWNFEEFVKEKLARWSGRSEEFKDSDAVVATGGRSAWNGEVVRNAI